jgi:acetyl esterase
MSAIGSWIEDVVGAPLPSTSPLLGVEGIAERRAFYESLPAKADPEGAVIVDERVVLRHGDVPLTAEHYAPAGRDAGRVLPAFIYLHGGAFSIWNARMVRRAAMRIAAAGFVVLNLEFRLAPEHPYPAALSDAIYAAHWIEENADALGIDAAAGVGIGGDSSGANLAAAAAVYSLAGMTHLEDAAHAERPPVPVRQLFLACGIYDIGRRLTEKSSGPGTTEIMVNLAYLGAQFLPKHADPLVSPARATNLADFPPTYIACGSRDNTLPQSLAFTASLAEADVDVTLSVFSGGDHEMLLLGNDRLPGVDEEWARISRWLTERSASA